MWLKNTLNRLGIMKKPLRLIMTLLVKDEEDIIEENLLFHKSMGVDGFIVTDNASSDRTRLILEKYQKKGWILQIIDEPSQNYDQCAWVNRMIISAIDNFKADWIINCDADEFWLPKSGDLKTNLDSRQANVLQCLWRNMIPQKDNFSKFWHATYAVNDHLFDTSRYNLSKWNMYDFVYPKVMHAAKGFQSIEQGNHNVEINEKKQQSNLNIVIYHFPIQNFKKFEKKVINGGRAYEKNTTQKKVAGAHWRYWYKRHKRGELREEYDRINGKEYFDEFLQKGILIEDKSIYNFFDNQKENHRHTDT